MEFNKAQDIVGLKVLSDNIIWLWRRDKSVVVIDPAVAKPVIEYIEQYDFQLEAILQTHHHADHIGGTKSLIERWPCVKVIASIKEKDRIPFQNLSVNNGDKFNILGENVQVIEVLGHTRSHIAFYLKQKEPILFVGDTLFSGGCGKIFEGTYEQMYASLKKIKSITGNTRVYFAHE